MVASVCDPLHHCCAPVPCPVARPALLPPLLSCHKALASCRGSVGRPTTTASPRLPLERCARRRQPPRGGGDRAVAAGGGRVRRRAPRAAAGPRCLQNLWGACTVPDSQIPRHFAWAAPGSTIIVESTCVRSRRGRARRLRRRRRVRKPQTGARRPAWATTQWAPRWRRSATAASPARWRWTAGASLPRGSRRRRPGAARCRGSASANWRWGSARGRGAPRFRPVLAGARRVGWGGERGRGTLQGRCWPGGALLATCNPAPGRLGFCLAVPGLIWPEAPASGRPANPTHRPARSPRRAAIRTRRQLDALSAPARGAALRYAAPLAAAFQPTAAWAAAVTRALPWGPVDLEDFCLLGGESEYASWWVLFQRQAVFRRR